jgi:hypothetical protein
LHHPATFSKDLFGWEGPPGTEQTAAIRRPATVLAWSRWAHFIFPMISFFT